MPRAKFTHVSLQSELLRVTRNLRKVNLDEGNQTSHSS